MMIQKKYLAISKAIQAYKKGKNITETLRESFSETSNTSEIIEIVYDLQSGSYIEYAKNNLPQINAYTKELAQIIDKHTSSDQKLLDLGSGELTNLTMILNNLKNVPKQIFASDISWSRLWTGTSYAKEHCPDFFDRLNLFVGDMLEMPILDKSIDIAISSHSLEPNGGREIEILSELFRITKKKLLLFEPCYETNSEEGKKRMEKLGYIRDLDSAIKQLGGKLIEKIEIKHHNGEPLNPTTLFHVQLPSYDSNFVDKDSETIFSTPGANNKLVKMDNFYFSNTFRLSYPIIKGIPILKSESAIITTAIISN